MGGVPWTAADIPDLSGRSAVVTGANSGIGYRAALELARHGAHVTLAVRDPGRGADALARLRRAVPDAQAELGALDLADQASVRAFAAAYRGEGPDMLVNNAGIMAAPLRRTPEGWEGQFATNHLGHFALTGLLLPRLLARPGARVVTVTSGTHRMGRIDFEDPHFQRRPYAKWPAYFQSKLANLLFTFELQRRAGDRLASLGAHPGYAATNLQAAPYRGTGKKLAAAGVGLANRVLGQSDEKGALPTLRAATDPAAHSGEVYGPDRFFEMRGDPVPGRVSAAARDEAAAARLWALSERETGVAFEF
jgi:NAD(P)-dependent dehydrogenase (short-subunit alcohol dehydrogenase family)